MLVKLSEGAYKFRVVLELMEIGVKVVLARSGSLEFVYGTPWNGVKVVESYLYCVLSSPSESVTEINTPFFVGRPNVQVLLLLLLQLQLS